LPSAQSSASSTRSSAASPLVLVRSAHQIYVAAACAWRGDAGAAVVLYACRGRSGSGAASFMARTCRICRCQMSWVGLTAPRLTRGLGPFPP
jgi:hypothetical protein